MIVPDGQVLPAVPSADGWNGGVRFSAGGHGEQAPNLLPMVSFVRLDRASSSREDQAAMYVSRLSFSVKPGHTHQVEAALGRLAELVRQTGAGNTRILRTSYASLGSPDLQFEQDSESLAALEEGMEKVTAMEAFQRWSADITPALLHSPKRELFRVAG
jgi:hypothetical protein